MSEDSRPMNGMEVIFYAVTALFGIGLMIAGNWKLVVGYALFRFSNEYLKSFSENPTNHDPSL